jgi:Ser-tRNA(Ala) deacylase AlaX
MTEKLYATDAYVKEFVATILKIDGNQIVLDRTAFYAENGGQVGDTGFLDQTRIVDTIYNDKNEKGYILHITDEESDFKQGDKVIGKIDWDRRYRIMRNHAASHIMEYFLFETFGRLKLIGTVVNERLEQVEKFANLFISENFEIKRWEDDTKPGWWYWKAGNIMMPCGGTHPNNTKEIGKISIKRKSGGKGKEKILTSVLD